MVGSWAPRGRRRIAAAIAIGLATTSLASMWWSHRASDAAYGRAVADARSVARERLAPLLVPGDLTNETTGSRARTLRDAIRQEVVGPTAVDRVRLYAPDGTILFAESNRFVGTSPSYVATIVGEAATGQTRSWIRDGALRTYVPIWLSPGGTVAVAELSRSWAPIAASASGAADLVAFIAGALALAGLVFALAPVGERARTGTPTPATSPAELLYRPAIPRRATAVAPARAGAAATPALDDATRIALEAQVSAAEARARAADDDLEVVRTQLKQTIDQMKGLEETIAMEETSWTAARREAETLREQLRETSERLHKAEIDNGALRERLALRQHDLDEMRDRLGSLRAFTTPDVDELQERVQAAESVAGQLARELDRVQNELEQARVRFHMTKLTEALHGFDGDAIEIKEDDEGSDHPVVIRNRSADPSESEVTR
jgi:hypothetical protein